MNSVTANTTPSLAKMEFSPELDFIEHFDDRSRSNTVVSYSLVNSKMSLKKLFKNRKSESECDETITFLTESSFRSSFNNSVATSASSMEEEPEKKTFFSIEQEDIDLQLNSYPDTDDDDDDLAYHAFVQKCTTSNSAPKLKSKRLVFSFRHRSQNSDVEPMEAKGQKSIMYSKMNEEKKLKKIRLVPSLRINTPGLGLVRSDTRLPTAMVFRRGSDVPETRSLVASSHQLYVTSYLRSSTGLELSQVLEYSFK